MASGQNQTNRLGHGIATKTGTAIGQYSVGPGTEVDIGTILADVYAGSGLPPAAPFEIRILAAATGLELRTAAGVSGFPLIHAAALVDPAAISICLAQNAEAPTLSLLVNNSTLGAIVLYVMALS